MALASDHADPGVRAEQINKLFGDAGYTREFVNLWWNDLAFPELGSRTPTRAWHDRDYEAVESLARRALAGEPATRAWLNQALASVADRSVLERIAAQRAPADLVDSWRAEHPK